MAEATTEIAVTLKLTKREASFVKTCVQNVVCDDSEELKQIRENIWKAIHECKIDTL